jgi:hypothetical protein
MEKYESPRIEKFQNEAETALALDRTYFAWGCGALMASRVGTPSEALTLQEIQDMTVAAQELTTQMHEADVTIAANYLEENEFVPRIPKGKEISDRISGRDKAAASKLKEKIDKVRSQHPETKINLIVRKGKKK